MEQKKEPRNKPIHLQSINHQQRWQQYIRETRDSSVTGAMKAGHQHVNNQVKNTASQHTQQ